MNSKPIIHAGIGLFLLGSAMLTYQDVSSPTLMKVVDVNLPPARAETPKVEPRSPLVGGVLLAGGILLIAVGVKKAPWRR